MHFIKFAHGVSDTPFSTEDKNPVLINIDDISAVKETRDKHGWHNLHIILKNGKTIKVYSTLKMFEKWGEKYMQINNI